MMDEIERVRSVSAEMWLAWTSAGPSWTLAKKKQHHVQDCHGERYRPQFPYINIYEPEVKRLFDVKFADVRPRRVRVTIELIDE